MDSKFSLRAVTIAALAETGSEDHEQALRHRIRHALGYAAVALGWAAALAGLQVLQAVLK